MPKVVIADSSCLIILSKIGELELLLIWIFFKGKTGYLSMRTTTV